jgi:hypothetical protein
MMDRQKEECTADLGFSEGRELLKSCYPEGISPVSEDILRMISGGCVTNFKQRETD